MSDIQSCVIALIDGVGDVGNADAVADLPHPGGAGAQLVHGGAVGALAHGADDRAAGDKNLVAGLVLADQALAGDAQAGVLQWTVVYLSTICMRMGRWRMLQSTAS